MGTLQVFVFAGFLMHRVELKEEDCNVETLLKEAFLMHRVELKDTLGQEQAADKTGS